MEDEEIAEYQVFAKKVAVAIKRAFPCIKVGEAVLGLEVPHAHIHLIPMQSEKDMLFSNPKLKEWFGGGWTLFNECSILSYDPHTDKLTEHRPDRVMKCGDEVQIVDFKFGKPQPEHTDQVQRYISLMHSMGYTDVKGYLWYVYSDNIVEV